MLNPKIDLIKSSKWQSKHINKFTTQDTTNYYGGLSIINNDSYLMSHVNKITGELTDRQSKWTVDIFDSLIVFQRKHPEIVDSILIDSSLYKLFWFSNHNVLKIDEIYYAEVDKKESLQLPDSMYSDIIEFEIGGYKIGDVISKDLVIIKDVMNYYSPPRETGHLKNDESLHLTIVGDSIIVSIEQREISDSDIDDIIKVITEKTGFEPKHSPPDTVEVSYGALVFESYNWGGYSEQYRIDLSRHKSIQNETSDEIDKLMILSMGVGWSNWDLEIESSLLEGIIYSVYFSNFDEAITKSQYIK